MRSVHRVVVVFFSILSLSQSRYSLQDAFKQIETQAIAASDAESISARHLLARLMNDALLNNTATTISNAVLGLQPQSNQALRMLDATGKPSSGILDGNVQFFGDYDECVNLGSDTAHYCIVATPLASAKYPYKLIVPLLQWGFCVNSTTDNDTIGNAVFDLLRKEFLVPTEYASATCYDEKSFTAFQIILITVFSLIGLVILFSTLYDIIVRAEKTFSTVPISLHVNQSSSSEMDDESEERNGLLNSSAKAEKKRDEKKEDVDSGLTGFFFAFSLARNLPKLLNVDVQSKEIQCLHGLRTLSMFWVILGHSYIWDQYGYTIANPLDAYTILRQFAFQAVANAFYSVDSFFFLSGVLVMYLSYQRMKANNGRFPWLAYYLHRLWRLTPAYMVVLLILWQLSPYFGDGPVWYQLSHSTKLCDSYWWTNLLYVNNFHPTNFSDECMGWTWYLANDMQMHVISPIIIIPAFAFGFIGLIIPLGICLTGVFLSLIIISSKYHFQANAILATNTLGNYQNLIYSKFYTRASPYLVGLFLGYCLARSASDQFKYHKFLRWMQKKKHIVAPVAWFVAFALGLVVIYGVYDYNRGNGHKYPEALSVMYLTFSTFLWGLALAILVFMCYTGHGGVINAILSWGGWIPLSRLTYSAYLVHPLVLTYIALSARSPVYFLHRVMVFRFVGAVGISYLFAMLLSLSIEYPCAAIEKVVRKSTICNRCTRKE
ncbi:nose resistant to fluoxetine protein 6-like [Oscarella lobularis]|uniref:nose resistant to fluoxetine protein 6-like n=1 Tax=Oscarella lobularis TaxID=121494 RepID=UPI003313527D